MKPFLVIQGRRGLFLTSDPRPLLSRERFTVDSLEETWSADFPDDLVEGQAHPNRPGMIIRSVRAREDVPCIDGDAGRVPGIYFLDVLSEGSHDNSKPTKILSRGKRRTTAIGWDERMVRYLTWHHAWKACTATEADDIVTTPSAHGFSTGQRVVFARLTGGAGITAQSSSSLGTVYFFHVLSATTGKLCTTLADAQAGTNFVNITSNMTAGEMKAAEFAPGARHPDHANLFLVEGTETDDNNDWATVDCVYRGLEEDKPYHRIITCAGQQMSSSEPIIWDFIDGWEDARYSAVHMPEIVCNDTYLTTDTLATNTIPYSSGEGATPPSPPSVRSVFIFGDTDSIIHNWPNGWSRFEEAHVDTLSSGITVHLKRRVSRYVWPTSLK
ncbi:MAG: hypothetical protein KCHDKBKB_02998 [Elusimicrobia bacterium]|nr:hypothetical protein [Elusimicrobiota bacterium]